MLTTPSTFGEIARVGPIRRQAFKIRDKLADPERTGYVAVAVAEEMPINETLDLEQRLPEAVGSQLEAIVVNGMWPERFSAADADALRASADGVRPSAPRDVVRAGAWAALAPAAAAAATEAKVVTLPYLFDAEIGLPEYEKLAATLARKL